MEVSEKAKRTNPRKIPRTQSDVDKAWGQGADFGCDFCLTMFLLVLKDKHGSSDDDILTLRDEFEDMVSSYRQKYMSLADAKRALCEDYDISVKLL